MSLKFFVSDPWQKGKMCKKFGPLVYPLGLGPILGLVGVFWT